MGVLVAQLSSLWEPGSSWLAIRRGIVLGLQLGCCRTRARLELGLLQRKAVRVLKRDQSLAGKPCAMETLTLRCSSEASPREYNQRVVGSMHRDVSGHCRLALTWNQILIYG